MQPNQFTNARKSVECYVGCVKKLNELCFNFSFIHSNLTLKEMTALTCSCEMWRSSVGVQAFSIIEIHIFYYFI